MNEPIIKPKGQPKRQPNLDEQEIDMNAVMHRLPVDVHSDADRSAVVKPSQAHNAGKYLRLAGLGVVCFVAWGFMPWSVNWLVLAIPLLALVLRAGWLWLDLACMSYRFDDGQRVVWSYGVLSRTSGSLEVYRVQTVTMHQTVFERLWGVGTVILETRDETNRLLPMVGMRDPDAFRGKMTAYVQQARRARGVQEAAVN